VPRNWDAYYSGPAILKSDPDPMLVQVAEHLPPGRALDLACGSGRNSLYLAKLGWQVVAVDASAIALAQLRGVETHLADLEKHEFTIEAAAYDLICDFHYLQRDLFPAIRDGLRPGGVFIGAIHLVSPAHNPSFALQPGELRKQFAGWKITFYSESPDPPGSRATARIVARRA
jgi:tellurite methyltransferase